MKQRKYTPLIFIILTLITATLACRLGGRSRVELGETFQSDMGGFILQTVPDYDVNEFFGMLIMAQPGSETGVGPLIMAMGELLEEDITAQQIIDQMQREAQGFEFSSAKRTRVDGIDGFLVEFSGEQEGQSVRGKIFAAAPRPMQEFTIFAIAPEGQWKGLEPIFDAVLASITFIDAQPLTFEFEDPDFFDQDWDDDQVWDDPTDELDTSFETGQAIRQWAVFAEASSEFSSEEYAALQATGAPDVDACEENPNAWASAGQYTEEYLVLYYEIPVNPTELVIYQSHNPSQIVEIQFEDITGETWVLWYGEPHESEFCPDVWTHYIELDEVFYTDTVVIFVDQSILGLGWVEIDAVELVGYPMEAVTTPVQQEPEPVSQGPIGDIPTNYEGLMAGPIYQGWISIVLGETMEADLDRIMTIEGRKSTDSWKPRESHKQTYLYQMPWDGMTGFISVTNEGWVYRINVSPTVHPDDFALATVNRETYDALNAIYNLDKAIPYEVMANILESPGFLRETYIGNDDGIIRSTYNWYNARGDRITGIFVDGVLTGMMGLNFIEAD